MSKSRAKGTFAESALVRWFQVNGWPFAERRALAGGKDKGDLTGMPGLVVECKNAVRVDLPGWLRETRVERDNARADYGVLVIKTKGYGDTRTGEWAAVMSVAEMTHLLRAAGYGTPLTQDGAA